MNTPIFGRVKPAFPDGGHTILSDGECLPMPSRWSMTDKAEYSEAVLVRNLHQCGGGVLIWRADNSGEQYWLPCQGLIESDLEKLPSEIAAAYRYYYTLELTDPQAKEAS